jgi:formylglycine-generating enzyme required for sulfatase activity
VTVEQWRRFEKGSGYTPKKEKADLSSADGSLDLYPAANILWAEAQQYANWAHKSLPTEAQWEKAARGTDGRIYPWGNEPISDERGVFVKMNPDMKDEITHYQMVGSKPAGASHYGCMDMAGNVYEWTSEWLEPYPNNPEFNKAGPWGHQFGVLRGGSFYHGRLAYACAKRFGLEPGETYYHMGFRSVWTPPIGYFESEAFKADAANVKARTEELAKLRVKGAKVPPPAWS